MAQQTAIVTGGSQGIGAAIAALLASCGYRVALADLRAPAGPLEAGSIFLKTDVSSEVSVRACVRTTVKRFGRLDALINNAGIASAGNGPVEKLSVRDWNRRIGVNLTGAFLMAKHCVPHLRRQQGAIVNIASTRALQSERDTEAYSASKGGLVALTHALAISLGPRVRVNCVSPGWIDVSASKKNGRQAKLSRKDHGQHPAGRVGQPEDVAEIVAYLLSDAAGFVTGQNFVVDGGMTKKMIYV